MDGFVVMACYMGEDIPCGLFAEPAEAKAFAASLPWSLEGVVKPNDQPHDEWSAAYMVIIEFRDGKRVNTEWVRDFEAECVLPAESRLCDGGKKIEREARSQLPLFPDEETKDGR